MKNSQNNIATEKIDRMRRDLRATNPISLGGRNNTPPVSRASRQKPAKDKRRVSLSGAILLSVLSGLFFACLSILVSWLILRGSVGGSTTIEQSVQTISSEGDVFNRISSEVGQSVVSIVSANAAGTGVVIDSDGLILTNKHVIDGAAGSVTVIDHAGREYSASILGRDPNNDIAFLRVSNPGFDVPAAKLADSSKVKVGDKVLAIGNALGEFQNTVTSGIVSGIGRPIDVADADGALYESLFNLIQTDAAINPGNSGGPLVNMNGEVIGINTAIVQDAQSLGFSIPVNDIKPLVARISADGNLGDRAYLGVRYIGLTENIALDLGLRIDEGAVVYNSGASSAVEPGSPANLAGIRDLDVIVAIDDSRVDDLNSLSSVLARFTPGQSVELTVFRDGKNIKLSAILGSLPN